MTPRSFLKSLPSLVAQRKNGSLRQKGEEILRARGEDPMAIVLVDGGLCSAITKYVLGECFRKAFGMVVKYDLMWFETNGMDCSNKNSRLFTLTALFPNFKMDAATQDEIDFYKRHFYHYNPKPYWYYPAIFDHPQPLYFDGYAEHWKYVADVEDKVLSELRFKHLELNEANRDVLSNIHKAPISIAVHVRRGNYVSIGMAMLGEDYYRTAIDQIVSASDQDKAKVFFSDDIDWVRRHLAPKLPPHIELHFIDVNNTGAGHLVLLLISECDHQNELELQLRVLGRPTVQQK